MYFPPPLPLPRTRTNQASPPLPRPRTNTLTRPHPQSAHLVDLARRDSSVMRQRQASTVAMPFIACPPIAYSLATPGDSHLLCVCARARTRVCACVFVCARVFRCLRLLVWFPRYPISLYLTIARLPLSHPHPTLSRIPALPYISHSPRPLPPPPYPLSHSPPCPPRSPPSHATGPLARPL